MSVRYSRIRVLQSAYKLRSCSSFSLKRLIVLGDFLDVRLDAIAPLDILQSQQFQLLIFAV